MNNGWSKDIEYDADVPIEISLHEGEAEFIKFYMPWYRPTLCGNPDSVLEYLDALSRGDKDSTKSEDE